VQLAAVEATVWISLSALQALEQQRKVRSLILSLQPALFGKLTFAHGAWPSL
jgi:hypothetical protein